jgi:uncharacterized Zn-finger protein
MLRGVLHRACSSGVATRSNVVARGRSLSNLPSASPADQSEPRASIAFKKTGGKFQVVPADTSAVPKPRDAEEVYLDEVTHTGQAWDNSDYRLARFEYRDKQVNPNVAAHLVAEIKPVQVASRVVACDGGGGALGHPKVYINLDKPGNHICGYCGLRFTKAGQENPGIDNPGV